MRTIVVGDLHQKAELVLGSVDAAMAAKGAEEAVFLGDYCDEWGSTPAHARSSLECLRGWAASRAADGFVIHLLIGNHDAGYLGGTPCSGAYRRGAAKVSAGLRRLPLEAACAVDGMLLTHAGLTTAWAEMNGIDARDARAAADGLNRMLRRAGGILELSSCGPGRGGPGVPGPLWADRRELALDAVPGFSQIVGHSPVPTCLEMRSAAGSTVLLSDTFSLTRRLAPIGDGSMWLIGDGWVPEKVTRRELGLAGWDPFGIFP